MTTEKKARHELDEQSFLNVVEEWQMKWMNQKQNSEADYQNYWRRAFGVDANMRHSLAKMVHEKHAEFCEQAQEKTDADFAIVRDAAERYKAELTALKAKLEVAVEALEYYAEAGRHFGSNDGGAKAEAAIKRLKGAE